VQHAHGRGSRRFRDRGATLVEILVSIVLLGTAVGGTLTALRTTIVSNALDEDRSAAELWLRQAEEQLYFAPYVSCSTTDGANVVLAYRSVLQSVAPPPSWGGGTIDITSISYWGRDGNRHEGWRLAECDVAPNARVAQLVEFYVRSPDGDVGRTIQVVKRG
jgi:hypothetical protein